MWVMGTSGASPTPRSLSSGHGDHAPVGRSVGLDGSHLALTQELHPQLSERLLPATLCPAPGRAEGTAGTHSLPDTDSKRLASPGRETNPVAQLWPSGSPMGPGFSQTRAHPFLAFLLCQSSCCPNFLSPESIPSTNLFSENLG